MARKKTTASDSQVTDYRHVEKRKNIPPAGLAAQGRVREVPRARYAYDPHLPPVLRFDSTGKEDAMPELLETARQRALTADEARLLADALRNRQPWLEWAGKREKAWFEVDPVALHIHERASAQAILKLAQRQPLQRSMFADPELEYRQAVQFYQHDMDWANRLILGDSLTVMHSLAQREDLAGKVQMIYIDPPYGIKFASNFQAEVGKRDVKDKDSDLTREPEQVKAYRDTWALGVHSYLAYLRDRFITARGLLTESGSIFVQISDENLHLVRMVMEEVFGTANFVALVTFRTTSDRGGETLGSNSDYLLWYTREISALKYRQLYHIRNYDDDIGGRYTRLQLYDGTRRFMFTDERNDISSIATGATIYRHDNLTSQGTGESGKYTVSFNGISFLPGKGTWKTNRVGMERLLSANRIAAPTENSITYVRFFDDFPYFSFTSVWADTQTGAFTDPKVYVVQTNTKVIERCILMTTDPGDLVLDPTCGSGTTAYVAEQWGRRWITIDTSRVAVALARQRLLTSKYDYYELKDPAKGPSSGFPYKSVPHITLKSIAQNQALDPIFARWEPVLVEKLAALNAALSSVTPEVRTKLLTKLAEKERREGKSAINDADRRRWVLPPSPPAPLPTLGEGSVGWREWEVPFDTDPDWPEALQAALKDYRHAWRSKMDEVNATIAASAPQEELVDKPEVVSGVVRVSGPFTVEGVQPIEETLELETPIGGEPEELEAFAGDEPTNAEAYLEKMIRLLRQDGVRFPDNKVVQFTRLEPVANSLLHAEGEWGIDLSPGPSPEGKGGRRVAVSFGPQYGPITAKQVEECLREAYRRAYDDLVLAGFSIDGAAQAIIQEDPNPQVRCHLAHIRPDVNMGDLLKDTPSSQLFTVFGLPRVNLERLKNDEFQVEMEGVDIYDPVTNVIQSTGASKVAAWFLDSDYDGQTFCITQAFFPDASAWDKIARALKSTVDPERFAAFSGTKSLPFSAGEHGKVAVKVIDPRGNEVMRVIMIE
jgi:adenine-specific DNA-methyltransferase